MAMIDANTVERLLAEHNHDLDAQYGRLGRVRRYLDGDQDLPYMPRGAKAEYRRLAEESITNWLGLVSDTFTKGLFVDGYRSPKKGTNAPAWEYWQANGMDARQTIIHRGVVDHGTAYGLALPSKGSAPVMRALSPLKAQAWYEDEDDDFPVWALLRGGKTMDGSALYYTLDRDVRQAWVRPSTGGPLRAYGAPEEHGMGVTPLVRFRDRLDGQARGLIHPLIRVQDRINEIVFSTMIALQYASFRQRWATGLAIPTDDDGNPVEPFSAAVDRLWVAQGEGDQEVRFGEFAQTDTTGHGRLYHDAVKTLSAQAQISPNVLTGDLINLSAEALAQMDRSTQQKLGELETLLGESWETWLRLAAHAQGDTEAARDTTASVRWRDTEARALSATVDALGKEAQMLQVPVEALWEQIPGVTDEDIEYWKTLRAEGDPLASIAAEISRQTAPDAEVAPETAA